MENSENTKEIYLAGGCFWGIEAYLKKLPGVLSTDVGYANGNTETPTYQQVCQSNTGHAEAVHVVYQPDILSLITLLKAYFQVIDPISKNKQGNDRGTQYRTGIYYVEDEDLSTIRQALASLQNNYTQPIQIEVLPLNNYSLAESYHQNYLEDNPRGYCHINLNSADTFIKEHNLNLIKVIKAEHYYVPTNQELKKKLTDLQYHVTQDGKTERPFMNEYDTNFEEGIYVDIVTGEPLFTSFDKFNSGCGWPSFSKPIIPDVVTEVKDTGFNMVRTEVRSHTGNTHLGHVFDDGPKEQGGLRYCINSASMRFIAKDQLEAEGYGYLKILF